MIRIHGTVPRYNSRRLESLGTRLLYQEVGGEVIVAHPGAVLKHDILEPLGLTITSAAKDLGVTRKALSELVNGRTSLSPEMAVRVSIATNTFAESWLNMQNKLDVWNIEHAKDKIKVSVWKEVS